ncbi:hypothetical protein AB0I53_43560 [Saccharopolyspora sp. NPDC050389]|uniref:hypothetical protein n=1 Tax=Saccharopolyspora sp. NPDC050389 TaxID=3155516 RepID=UPI0033F86889
MTATVRGQAELSCYTANLAAYLAADEPEVWWRLAEAVRLRVRPHAGGGLIFSHHARIDRGELAYAGAAEWAECATALRDELTSRGRVLAVANTGYLPWAPGSSGGGAPHWVLVTENADGAWHVVDEFAALLPTGEQHPQDVWLTDDELRRIMTPVHSPSEAVRNRDAHALGEQVSLPPYEHYRWLTRTATPVGASREWPGDTVSALDEIAENISGGTESLAAHIEDVWAAARHHRFQLTAFVSAGLLAAEQAQPALDAWGELPRSLRFALDSARRARPRPGLVTKTFAHLTEVTRELISQAPQAFWRG